MLTEGQILLRSFDGRRLRVNAVLGQGGEGTVYSADFIDAPGYSVAVKWYHSEKLALSRLLGLKSLVDMGPPNDRFLWPDSLVTASDNPAPGGYTMPLRPAEFVGFNQLLNSEESLPFAILATIGRNLADSFHALHAAGLAYRDIKDANLFVRTDDGEILVCDNDNVAVDGAPTGVQGSLYFMAPEVMRGDKPPSKRSDQFSLAVLLFYLLARGHALEGRRTLTGAWDADAQMAAFAHSPLFIFDEHDRSNAPDPQYHAGPLAYWPVLPQYVRNLFSRTFGPGLHDPWARVPETQWREALDDVRASVVTCICGAHTLHDPDVTTQRCWNCQHTPPIVPMLTPARPLGKRAFHLNPGSTLTAVNIDPSLARSHDHRRVVAVVEQHPSDASVFGLRNLDQKPWTFYERADASGLQVAPTQVLRVRDGTLSFSNGHSAILSLPGQLPNGITEAPHVGRFSGPREEGT